MHRSVLQIGSKFLKNCQRLPAKGGKLFSLEVINRFVRWSIEGCRKIPLTRTRLFRPIVFSFEMIYNELSAILNRGYM